MEDAEVGKLTQHIPTFLTGVEFKLYTSEEVKKISVLEITNTVTFNDLAHPTEGGLCDLRLGPSTKDSICETCDGTFSECNGHYGHISLSLPVFNPLLIRHTYQLLKLICFQCKRFLFKRVHFEVVLAQLKALELGLDYFVDELKDTSKLLITDQTGDTPDDIEIVAATLDQLIAIEISTGSNAKETTPLKNVVERRQKLFRELLWGKLVRPEKDCAHCNAKKKAVTIVNNSVLMISVPKRGKKKVDLENTATEEDNILNETITETTSDVTLVSGKSYFTPLEAREHLRELWKNEQRALKAIFGIFEIDGTSEYPTDIFFLDTILVCPNRFRPLRQRNGKQFEHERTAALNLIMVASNSLGLSFRNVQASTSAKMKSSLVAQLHYSWQRLQVLCNRLYDCDMDRTRDSRKLPGVKQVLEKKEGLFRKHMMGKRVNYAARSVISPDPYIMADEVGVPLVFATKLTYPEYVTKWNLRKLKEAVLNGPAKHPGAVSVQLENGSVIRIRADNPTQRRALANRIGTSLGYQMAGCKVVYRHLVTGDVLLLNRQPTLHKPSIMAHKVKVLPSEKTMRLHYANCKCYNADFDGDEMNAHFPQSEFGRAEAYNIANVARQFLVPKDGTPLSGLIQDHIIGTTLISIRGSFFCQADYNQLVFGALSFLNKRIKVLPPTIIKPIQLWSGKQVISTIILNIVQEKKYPPSLEIPSKVRHKTFICKPTKSLYWSPIQPGDMCESGVIIRNGELLCGVLDKSNIGPSQNGLIHCCYELYGGKVSNWLLTSFARVASNYLQIISGFSLGIHDILVKKPANKERRKLIEMSRTTGDEVTAQGLNVTEAHDEALIKDKYQDAHLSKDTVPLKQLDRAMKTQTDEITNKISGVCLPGLVKTFPHNNLQLMIQAGAKGGTVNALQISCLLGQIELEGRRVPLMMSGRSLPSFEPYDTSPRAGGFVSGRFLTGIRPQEFFFHCMAGREGLIDTAVKTSRSGYLQRCLIKHLEGLVVNYDLTVRDSDGSVIQFLYGEDGLDVSKSQLLKPDALNVLIRNYPSVKCDEREKLEAQTDKTKIEDIKASKEDWMSLNGSNIYKKRIGSMFNEYAQRLKDEIEKELEKVGKTPTYSDLRIAIDSWFQLSKEERALLNKYWLPCPGPVLGNVRPDSNYGAISEKLEDMVIDYMEKNPDKLLCQYSLSRVDEVDFTKEKYKPPITYDAFWNLIFDCYIRSLCDPGEAVGLLSAQSVGEPSTQMTLNTFHFAGRGDMNVTLGIPRLREIIMTASPNISTPNMDIPFRQRHDIDMENVAEKMRMKLNSVKLSDVLETVDVVEKLVLEERECSRIYEITFQFLPRECYRDKTLITPNYILNFMETKFLSILLDAIAKKMKYQSRYDSLYGHSVIIREKKPANNDDEGDEENIVLGQFKNAPDEEASSDEDEEIEGDTTAAKSKARRDQDLGYEEPEEVEKQDKDSDLDDDDDKEEHELEQDGNVSGQEDEVQLVAVIKRKKLNLKFAVTDEEKEERIKNVEESSTFIASYDFDSVHQQWCKVQIRYELAGSKIDMCCVVEDEAKKCRIYKVGKIERAFLVKDQHAPNGGFDQMLKTEGVSFTQLAKFADIFDLRRVYSNDIHAVANTFGIEAARKVIQMEITSVFAAYGIKVDARHLSLISDYMTFDGTIKGMNRMSMTMSSSPIQQMTFETTTAFLKSAVMLGFKDDLTSPSARIFAGCPPAGGTGCVELRQKIVELPPSPTKILYDKYKAIESSWSYGSKSASMSMMSNRSFSGFSSPSPSKKLKLNWD